MFDGLWGHLRPTYVQGKSQIIDKLASAISFHDVRMFEVPVDCLQH